VTATRLQSPRHKELFGSGLLEPALRVCYSGAVVRGSLEREQGEMRGTPGGFDHTTGGLAGRITQRARVVGRTRLDARRALPSRRQDGALRALQGYGQ
jgi:hypothetical protein